MSLKQNIYGSLFVSNNITGNTLNLSTINENNSLTQLLVRDNINGVINYRDVSSIISAATSADTFVTGFTYDDSNNLTISRNDGTEFTTNIDIMSGLTINGDLLVTGTTNISGLTSINSSLDVYNGTIGLRDNDYFLQGTSTGGTNVQLIGVFSNNDIVIGNQGYTNRIMDDTIIKGELDILSGLTLSFTPTLNNSGTDILIRNSSTGEVEYRPVSGITPDTNTFVTGFTYDNVNTFTISRNDDVDLTSTISILSGITYYGDGSNLSGITNTDTFVTGSTLSGSTLLLSRNDGVELTTDLSSILFTGNTSGDCITDLYITNLYGCSPITVNDTLNLTNNARLNINAISSFTLAVESYDNNIATFRDVDGEDIFFAQGSLANQDLVFGFGDFSNAYGYAGYTLDTVLNQHNFTNGNLYLGNSETFNADTKLYVDGNAKVTGSLSATTFYGDGSNLTGISTDNFYVSGGTYNSGTDDINFVGNSTETTFDVDLSSLVSSVSGDTFVVSGNANAATSQLTFTNNSGGTFTVTNSAALFSDNDINVTGGTYNPSSGCVTFTTNSGTTFDVCGFVTGITDTFTTGSTLVGETIQFDSNILGTNYYNVSLSPVLSGKTDNLTFNSYTSNTETILNSKVSGATNLSTTGLFAQKNGDNLEFKGLTSTGGTVTITNDSTTVNLEVVATTDTNSFSTGGTVTQSATSGDSEVIVQIVGNSGFTPYNITGLTDTFVNDFSISSNTFTISQNDGSSFVATADTIDLASVLSAVTFDIGTSGSISATTFNGGTFNGTFVGDGSGLTGITDNDTFVTGFTYDDANRLTISRNDDVDLSTSINTMTGLTVNGTLSATTYFGDGSNLTGISNTFVTGFTYNDANTFTISNNDGTSFNSSINIMTGFTVNNGVGVGFVTINSTSGQELEINQRGVNFNYSTPNIQVGTTGANMMIGSTGGIGSYPSGTYPGLNLNTTTGDIFLFNGGYGGTGAVMDFQGGNIRDIHDIQSSGNWPLKLYGGPGPNDANDGIQMYTADNLNVYTKKFEIKADTGTPNAYFTNINNFGVNTTTPQHTLDVNGTTRLLGLTANTLNLVTTPTLNNSATDILVRNSSTGEVEYRPTPDTNSELM